MAERVFNWSSGIMAGLIVVLIIAVAADVGSPVDEIIGGLTFFAFLTSFVSWKMAGEPGRDSTNWISPGGGLALVLAAGTLLAVPSIARAEVDCWWSEIECREDTECAWDAQRHSHRCMPMREDPAAAGPAAEAERLQPVRQCSMQDEAECPTDYPHAYRACVREVRAHNAACVEQQAACEDTKDVARIACMPEERGGTFDRRIPDSVAACGRARDNAVAACPAPTRAAPPYRTDPKLDNMRCTLHPGGHPSCPP